MFEDMIQDLILDSDSLSDYLSKLYSSDEEIVKIAREIEVAKEGVLTKKNRVKSSYLAEVRQSVKDGIDFINILKEKIVEARRNSLEYGKSEFNGIMSIPYSDQVYSITEVGTGFSSKINVIYDLDPVAGTLGEYAVGVKKFRESLDNYSKKDPKRASSYWKNRVYGDSDLYSSTILGRLEMSGGDGKAPYWRLFDEGSSLFMITAWGGDAFPDEKGADFTGKASKEASKLFRSGMKQEKEITDNVKERVTTLEFEITILMNKIKDRVNEVTKAINEAKVREIIARHGNDLDKAKLVKTLDSIITSEEIVTQTRGRISLGKRGKDVRVRLKSFISEVQ